MQGSAILAIDSPPGTFSGLMFMKGSYTIKANNDSTINENFAAKLSVAQTVDFTGTFEDGYLNSNIARYNELSDTFASSLEKAKAFRNPDCVDHLHFSGLIELTYIANEHSSWKNPPKREFPINSLDDLEHLVKCSPHCSLATTLQLDVTSKTRWVISSMLYCFDRIQSIYSGIATPKATTITIIGSYEISGTCDKAASHNVGYESTLSLKHDIHSNWTHDSDKDKDAFNNILSTVMFKLRSFRNIACGDTLQLSGHITINFDDAGHTTLNFSIKDLTTFESFVDYVKNLALPSLALRTAISSDMRKPLLEDCKDEPASRKDEDVTTCWKGLRSICG